MRASVVLPQPLSPTMAKVSPVCASKLTSWPAEKRSPEPFAANTPVARAMLLRRFRPSTRVVIEGHTGRRDRFAVGETRGRPRRNPDGETHNAVRKNSRAEDE